MVDPKTDFSDVYDVVKMRFSILSPDDIIKNSVVPVFNTELNEGSSLETPKCNGVNDPRMGPANQSSIICPIDENTYNNCPGYFGHIELAKPVFWPEFMQIIINVIRYTCYNCSKLLIETAGEERTADKLGFEVAQRLRGKQRYEKIKQLTPKRACLHCQAVQPKYSREQNTRIIAEFRTADSAGSVRRVQFSAERIRTILSRMTNDDIEALGFHRHYSRPEWMVCTMFPVAPPAIRPSTMRTDTSQRSEDDLTIKLVEIVKCNRELARKLASENSYNNIDDYVQLLQVHIAAFVNNDINGGYKVMRKSGGPFKSIVQRFKGKTGRIRGNLMGKRANFSARSVITGDPTISVEEVGVPYVIAMNLTYPEVVTALNIDKLTKLVHNGPFKFPGAKSIRKRGSGPDTLLQLKPLDQLNQLGTIRLQIGDTVNRHIVDGDHVLFNRQPSLHRMSMLSHRVRVLNGYTFRLQLAVVAPYNAD